jgi:hypothetical protein
LIKREWDLLFSRKNLQASLEAQLESVNEHVLKIDPQRFQEETDDLLAASIASKLVVSPIELLEDEISVSSKDTKIDVRYDQNRAIFDRSRPIYH